MTAILTCGFLCVSQEASAYKYYVTKINRLNVIERNNNQSHYWLNTVETSYTLNLHKGEIVFSLPIENMNYTTWRHAEHKALIAPSIDVNWKLTPSLTADATIGYNQDANTSDIMYKGMSWNNYRTVTVGLDSLPINKTLAANCRLSYLNTSNLLSMNLFAGWSRQNRDFLMEYLCRRLNTGKTQMER